MNWHLRLKISSISIAGRHAQKNTFLVQSQEQFFFHLRSVGKHISGIGQGHYASVFDVGERCDKMELSNILTETHTETLV